MSEQNVEIVRRSVDLFNRGEIDRALDAAHDDLEMDWSNSIGPLKGIYRGRQKVREVWGSFFDAWDSVQWNPEEIVDVGKGRVLLLNRVRMRGRGSGIDVDARSVQLWTISEGKLQSFKLYQSKADAVEAAGLRD